MSPIKKAAPPLCRRRVQLLLFSMVACVFAMQLVYHVSHSSEVPETGESATIQIDINLAESRELALLPSVGPILAERIVKDREANGGFHSILDLKRVRGIGEKKLESIAEICIVSPTTDTRAAARLARQTPQVSP